MGKSKETMTNEGYEIGLNEAWNLAARISTDPMVGGLDVTDLKEIFQTADTSKIVIQNTYQEAAEKIKAWEDSKKIHEDDVVRDKDTGRYGLVLLDYNDDTCYVRWQDGSSAEKNMQDIAKTGHKINISVLLQQKIFYSQEKQVDD